MKILIDVNLSPDWVDFLAPYVHQAIHWSEIGDPRAEDFHISDYALRESFVVMTQDLDFGRLLSESNASGPSLILIRAGRVTPATLGMQVIAAIQRLPDALMAGSIITIERTRTRVTALPIRMFREDEF